MPSTSPTMTQHVSTISGVIVPGAMTMKATRMSPTIIIALTDVARKG